MVGTEGKIKLGLIGVLGAVRGLKGMLANGVGSSGRERHGRLFLLSLSTWVRVVKFFKWHLLFSKKSLYKVFSSGCVYIFYLSYFTVGFLLVGDIGGTDSTRDILPTTYVTSALFDRKQGSHFDIGT
jgi:hypothetical protein